MGALSQKLASSQPAPASIRPPQGQRTLGQWEISIAYELGSLPPHIS